MLENFEYKRKNPEPKDPHPIYEKYNGYGILSINQDPAWIQDALEDMYNKMSFHMGQVMAAIQAGDSEKIKETRSAFYKAGAMYLSDANGNKQRLRNVALEPTRPDNRADLYLQEIRGLLRAVPEKERHELIRKNLDKGKVEFLQAVATAPDEIVGQDFITDTAIDYSCKQNPSLKNAIADAGILYSIRRRRIAELNACAIEAMRRAGLDSDEATPWQDHYACFTPQDDKARSNMERKLKNLDELEKKKQYFENAKEVSNG